MKYTVLGNSFPLIRLVVVILIALGLVAANQRGEVITLSFFRVVDKGAYARSPTNYERAVYRDRTEEDAVYIERRPAHQISVNGIETVIVGKVKKFGNSPEERKEMERIRKEIETKGKVTKRVPETYPRGFYYSITFKMRASEFKKFVIFANKNSKGSFQMKLGKSDLGLLPHLVNYEEGSMEGTEFAIDTQIDDANRIKEMLSPIMNKVSWE